MRALLAVGTGRYADPWHPFAENASAIGDLLADDGWTVTVDDDVDHALASLDGVDLLVVIAGDPWGPSADPAPAVESPLVERSAAGASTPPVVERSTAGIPPVVERSAAGAETKRPIPPASSSGLRDAAQRGIGILALHAAVASLRDYPHWPALTGAIWLPGVSMHPPFEVAAEIRVLPHPLTDGLIDFTVADERYAHLQFTGDVEVLADHEQDGQRHPLVFTREVATASDATTRVAVDLLGHDPRSYDSPSHRDLLRRLARWASASPGR